MTTKSNNDLLVELGHYYLISWPSERKSFRGRMMRYLGNNQWLVWYPCDNTIEIETFKKRSWKATEEQADDPKIALPTDKELDARLDKLQTDKSPEPTPLPKKRGRPAKSSNKGNDNHFEYFISFSNHVLETATPTKKPKVNVPDTEKSAPTAAQANGPTPAATPTPTKKRARTPPKGLFYLCL